MNTTGKYILNADGEPEECTDLMTWAQWIETADRRVALDVVGDYTVSTVFLGLDHNYHREGPPELYETMIFADNTAGERPTAMRVDGWCGRKASTRAQALETHARMVALLRERGAASDEEPR